jgi:glyoxylase-like metal-dependent hydrolase (beta-lactamase superfamily II)
LSGDFLVLIDFLAYPKMQLDSSEQPILNSPLESIRQAKLPRLILEGMFVFSPNRETLGGTSYFIVEKGGNILIDCPVWDETTQQFLIERGGVRWLFLTHRGGIGKKISQMQAFLGCEVLIQEQEAYLLPDVSVTSFQQDFTLSPRCYGFWTSGHSPGSSCLYWYLHGGVLFSGRHLLPDPQGRPIPLRTAKTFHWFRQLDNVAVLRDRFTTASLAYICPGGNTGFLRGKGIIDQAYQRLSALDLLTLRRMHALEEID